MALSPEDVSLVRSLFEDRKFIDKAKSFPKAEAIDVIIPVLHSNDLWRENLLSYFREIPINRLLIGDGGCVDTTIDTVQRFPRVEIIDQTKLRTLGASIADLTKRVSTKNFAYLQSDVFLPPGWFEAMQAQMNECDWVGCPMQVVTIVDYRLNYQGVRPLAGAQMGRAQIFKNLDDFIDDDYVYRQEDFVLEEFVRRQGGEVGNTQETFHFHEVMRRKTTGMAMNVRSLQIQVDENPLERQRVHESQLRGFIKYCDPKRSEVRRAAFGAFRAQDEQLVANLLGALAFASRHNPLWRRYIYGFVIHSAILKSAATVKHFMRFPFTKQ